MKKLVISLVIFFSCFIFCNNVKALNYVVDYAPLTETQQGLVDDYLQNGIDTLRTKTTKLGFFQLRGNTLNFRYDPFDNYYWAKISLNSDNEFVLTMYYSASLDYYDYESSGWFRHYFYLDNNKYGSSTNDGNSNSRVIATSTITYDEYVTTYGSDYFYLDKIFPNLFIYSSDYKIKFMSSDDVYFDKFLNEVDYMPTYLDYSSINKMYEQDIEIDVTDLSYIKIDFDTKNTNFDDYHFTILNNVDKQLKEAYYEKSYEYGICYDSETCYDNFIIRENINFVEEMNLYSYSSPFKYIDKDNGFYDETQELNYFYIYYDVSNISGKINLSIDSTAPFNINYGDLNDYNDTFISLNLKNYNGLLLYPIVDNYNGDYQFYLNNANIDIYQYYDNKLIGNYKNISSDIYFFNEIQYQDRNRYFLIENNKLNEESYISFNTKYFYYQLIQNKDENLNIINPNTNKEEYINSLDISKNMTYFMDDMTNVNDMLDFISSNNNLESVLSKFNDIWNSFKKNGKIYTYLMLVITTSIIILVLKSMGK